MNGEIAARLKSNLFPHLGLAWSFSSISALPPPETEIGSPVIPIASGEQRDYVGDVLGCDRMTDQTTLPQLL